MDAFITGAWRSPGRGEAYIGGQWRRITRAEAYLSNAWRSVASFYIPLTVTANDTGRFQTVSRPTTITSRPSTAQPSGGLAPYSYQWVMLSGTAGVNSANTASTTFSDYLGSNSQSESTAQVTCTDALGSVATAVISISLSTGGLE